MTLQQSINENSIKRVFSSSALHHSSLWGDIFIAFKTI